VVAAAAALVEKSARLSTRQWEGAAGVLEPRAEKNFARPGSGVA